MQKIRRLDKGIVGRQYLPWLAALAAAYLLGAIVGCNHAASAQDAIKLEAWAAEAARVPQTVTFIGFIRAFYDYLRAPLLAYICGFTALGVFALPALAAWQGYQAALAAAAAVRLYGAAGVAAGFAVVGLPNLAALPVLFVLAVQAAASAGGFFSSVIGRPRGARLSPLAPDCIARLFLCIGALFLCTVYDIWLSPMFAAALQSAIRR